MVAFSRRFSHSLGQKRTDVEEIAELNRADQDRLDRMPTQAERRVGLVLSGFLTLIFSCCAALRDLMVTFTPDFEILPGTAPTQRQVPPGRPFVLPDPVPALLGGS
jgi:hypothetical protein